MSDSQASAMEKPENVNAVSKHTHKQTKYKPHKNSGTPVTDKSSRQPPVRKRQRQPDNKVPCRNCVTFHILVSAQLKTNSAITVKKNKSLQECLSQFQDTT